MGGWHLEAAKMVIYIGFPVAIFHWFNQPENFGSFVGDVRATCIPVHEKPSREEIERFIDEFNREKDLQAINAMEFKQSK